MKRPGAGKLAALYFWLTGVVIRVAKGHVVSGAATDAKEASITR